MLVAGLSGSRAMSTVGLFGVGEPRACFAQIRDGLAGGLGAQGVEDPLVQCVE